MSRSVDQQEIGQFSKDAAHWWDESGPFAPLHRLNPARLGYIKDQICSHFGRDTAGLKPYEGLSIVDVGCGGGIVCEPVARLGATVTGLDADPVAIQVAKDHAAQSGLKIEYLNESAESHLMSSRTAAPPSPRTTAPSSSRTPQAEGSQAISGESSATPRNDNNGYDVVLALEIIEHVKNPGDFVKSCAALAKPGGLVIFSTLNRTPKSFALGIVAAEYILRWVPRGTHNWKKFIKPSELSQFARNAGLSPRNLSGLMFNPLKGDFEISQTDIDVNYFLSCAFNCQGV